MECTGCGRAFEKENRVAAISGSILGDEVTDVYYLCPACGQYTVAKWWDNFTGEESMNVEGPLGRAAGDARVALIHACERAWDKKCRCSAHREYFNDALD